MFLIPIIILCVVLSAFFSGAGTAYSSLNRIRMKNLADDGNRKAKKVMKLYSRYDQVKAVILICGDVTKLAAAALTALCFYQKTASISSVVLSLVVSVLVILIVAELIPRSFADEFPEGFAMFCTPLLSFFVTVISPLTLIFSLLKKLISLLFKSAEDNAITEEELLTIVDEAEQEGGIDEQESELIRSAIEFNELEALDIFTPRVDVVAIPADASKEEVAHVFSDTGFSRLPVYEQSIDNIVGILHQKDFYTKIYQTDAPLSSVITPVTFITKTMKIGALLALLKKNKAHFAVIADEYGGTEGIVTMEDILEELVGEIWDEHDQVVEEFQQLTDNQYRIICTANVDKFFEFFDIEAEADSSSVSGWVAEQIGEVPEAGDRFQFHNLSVVVDQVENKRVIAILVTVEPQKEEEADA